MEITYSSSFIWKLVYSTVHVSPLNPIDLDFDCELWKRQFVCVILGAKGWSELGFLVQWNLEFNPETRGFRVKSKNVCHPWRDSVKLFRPFFGQKICTRVRFGQAKTVSRKFSFSQRDSHKTCVHILLVEYADIW